jgi:hypothetical protein
MGSGLAQDPVQVLDDLFGAFRKLLAAAPEVGLGVEYDPGVELGQAQQSQEMGLEVHVPPPTYGLRGVGRSWQG